MKKIIIILMALGIYGSSMATASQTSGTVSGYSCQISDNGKISIKEIDLDAAAAYMQFGYVPKEIK